MKVFNVLWVLAICAGCAQTTAVEMADRKYQRVDYYESVFLPAAQACDRAGGFLVFGDMTSTSTRYSHLSYADMRIAVSRGCAGI